MSDTRPEPLTADQHTVEGQRVLAFLRRDALTTVERLEFMTVYANDPHAAAAAASAHFAAADAVRKNNAAAANELRVRHRA